MSLLHDLFKDKTRMVEADRALPGRDRRDARRHRHFVLGTPLRPPFPDGFQPAIVGDGLLLGRRARLLAGARRLHDGGRLRRRLHAEPDLRGGLLGPTGHTEVVLAVFDPASTSYEEMLRLFWENHDPTQGMRQGNDVGTQYRSAIYFHDAAQQAAAERIRAAYAERCAPPATATITTEIAAAGAFYYAEDYHQQYLAKNPAGYCGLGGTGVSCPVGIAAAG